MIEVVVDVVNNVDVIVVGENVDVDVTVVCDKVDVDVEIVNDDDDIAVMVSGSFGARMENFNTSERVTATIVKTIKDATIILAQR